MATKMSKKKRNGIIIGSVAAFLALVLVIVSAVIPEAGPTVSVAEVKPREMTEYFTTTGTIESDNNTEYTMYGGTMVKTVNVKEGDTVEKGDVLATFDTAAVNREISEKREVYNKVSASYNEAVNGKLTAQQQLSKITSQSAALEKEIASLENKLSASYDKLPEIPDLDLEEIMKKLSEMTPEELQKVLEQILNAVPTLKEGSDAAAQFAEDLSKLIKDKTELIQLKVQKELFKSQSNLSVDEILKIARDTAKADLDKSLNKKAVIEKGWVAENGGLVTKVKVEAGKAFGASSGEGFDMTKMLSALSSGEMDTSAIISMLAGSGNGQVGLVVADTSKYVATFTAGKYDILKLSVGQKAKITTMGGTFDGEIVYISPTAVNDSSGFDINAIAGGLTGGSSAGCKVKVSIEGADRSVIEGFDVDVSIAVGQAEKKIAVPVETVIPESKTTSVFVYDPETKTVSKREVDFGITDDTYYQVESGLKEGELVVKNPTSEIADGSRVKLQKNS